MTLHYKILKMHYRRASAATAQKLAGIHTGRLCPAGIELTAEPGYGVQQYIQSVLSAYADKFEIVIVIHKGDACGGEPAYQTGNGFYNRPEARLAGTVFFCKIRHRGVAAADFLKLTYNLIGVRKHIGKCNMGRHGIEPRIGEHFCILLCGYGKRINQLDSVIAHLLYRFKRAESVFRKFSPYRIKLQCYRKFHIKYASCFHSS